MGEKQIMVRELPIRALESLICAINLTYPPQDYGLLGFDILIWE